MKVSWSATRKAIASITLVALTTAGMTFGASTAAHAVPDNEWSVKTTNVNATDNGWNGDVLGWYGQNSRWMNINATAGGSEVVTYQVQHNGTNAGAGVTVNLVAGKAYSGSSAVVTVNSQTTSGTETWSGADQATTSATTDSNGTVSFTIDGSAATASTFTQIYAWVGVKGVSAQWAFDSDTADVIDIHYAAASTPSPSATSTASSETVTFDGSSVDSGASAYGCDWWTSANSAVSDATYSPGNAMQCSHGDHPSGVRFLSLIHI